MDLAAQHRKVEELQAKVDQLELNKALLLEGVPHFARIDRSPALREKLRGFAKAFKNMSALELDAEASLNLWNEFTDIQRLAISRSKDPRSYADFLGTLHEVALEEATVPLRSVQSSEVSRVLEEMSQALSNPT
jgi:hypothetical protein